MTRMDTLQTTTGTQKWIFKLADLTDSGVLSTATDLVFAGSREGYFFALDARDGLEDLLRVVDGEHPIALLGVDELGGNADTFSGPADAAFNEPLNSKLLSYVLSFV